MGGLFLCFIAIEAKTKQTSDLRQTIAANSVKSAHFNRIAD